MRKPGYYFVFFIEKWIVAEWDGINCWWILGDDVPFKDSDFDEIDERPIVREEKVVPSNTMPIGKNKK